MGLYQVVHVLVTGMSEVAEDNSTEIKIRRSLLIIITKTET
jgi:hypothetical protein